jgi:ERCC4-related helicase
MDICRVLSRHQPLIRATYFVGQATSKKGAKGLKQTEQQDVRRRIHLFVFITYFFFSR